MGKDKTTSKNMKFQVPGASLPKEKSTKNDLPEAPRDPPGVPREGQEWRPHGAQRRSGRLQAFIWCSPGPFGEHLCLHFSFSVSHGQNRDPTYHLVGKNRKLSSYVQVSDITLRMYVDAHIIVSYCVFESMSKFNVDIVPKESAKTPLIPPKFGIII